MQTIAKRIESLETERFVNDITEEESKKLCVLLLDWYVTNKLDEDLIEYFLSNIRDEK